MGRGLGFWAGEEIDGGGGVGREQATCQRKKEVPTGWVHLWVGGRERKNTLSGLGDSGLGRLWRLGRNRPHGPFLFSYFFSLFLFTDLLFLLY
jgi:hypothetical protein